MPTGVQIPLPAPSNESGLSGPAFYLTEKGYDIIILMVKNTSNFLRFARVAFLVGVVAIISALVFTVLGTNPLTIIVLVLAGLVFATTALASVLVHNTKVETSRTIVVNDDAVDDPAGFVYILEILAYFFFIK